MLVASTAVPTTRVCNAAHRILRERTGCCPEAEKGRGAVCSRSAPDGAPAAHWLRELHRSHENGPGPFSICVHRPDVRSLSYTQIEFSGDKLDFDYVPRPPCEAE